MSKWKKQTLKLKDNHTWTAQPGCNVFVADRGAVRFDFPQEWVIVPDPDSIKLYDKQPPDDDCCLGISYMRLPPADWSGLPLRSLVEPVSRNDSRPVENWGDIVEQRRGDMEIAWREMRFIDPAEKRPAVSYFCLARMGQIQALLTFDFWEADRERCHRVWEIVLKSLVLDAPVEDPTRGRVIH